MKRYQSIISISEHHRYLIKKGLMNEADKPPLMNALAEIARPSNHEGVPSVTTYVIDGGWLLPQIPWSKGSKFKDICDDYLNFVIIHYSKQCTVVFDRYPDFSTKDTTHMRRTKVKVGRSIKPALNNTLSVKKEDFLLNKNNKQDFYYQITTRSKFGWGMLTSNRCDGDGKKVREK